MSQQGKEIVISGGRRMGNTIKIVKAIQDVPFTVGNKVFVAANGEIYMHTEDVGHEEVGRVVASREISSLEKLKIQASINNSILKWINTLERQNTIDIDYEEVTNQLPKPTEE